MIHTLLNVVYVLAAVAMIVLILLQRGAGASAGSGFGAGASGTVFGARGSANFLSTATKWLAALFFGLSLFMAWQTSHQAQKPQAADLGVMSDIPAAPAENAALPAAPAVSPTRPSPMPVIAPAAPASKPPAEQNPAPPPAEGGKDG
jgi:preprotein translocase subunit SecG